MAMIRHANAATMARDAVVLDLGDLTRQAQQIRAAARAEADRLLAEARAERERILTGAAEQGRAEGLARGLEEGRAQGAREGRAQALAESADQLAKLQESWTTQLSAFESLRVSLLTEARHDVLTLAIRMGELMTKRALAIHPEAVVDQLAAVLALIVRPTRLIIVVHPDDVPLIHEAMPALAPRFQAAEHIHLTTDETLERGSCIARSAGESRIGAGEIDASVATQLRRIVEALLPAALPGSPADDQLPSPPSPPAPPAEPGDAEP